MTTGLVFALKASNEDGTGSALNAKTESTWALTANRLLAKSGVFPGASAPLR